MALSSRRIAHITYVDEVDVTALEELRAQLNRQKVGPQPRLTILPFLMRGMVKAVAEQPALNAHYDDDAGIARQHRGGHEIGRGTRRETVCQYVANWWGAES